MDKTNTLRVAAALSALVALPAAAVAETPSGAAPQAQSYSELLEPIPNATERLRMADAQEPPARLIEAQYVPGPVVHDHHHHHHHWRRHWRRRHYHHHHHNNY